MLLYSLPRPAATAIRLAALALVMVGVATASHPPGISGRGLAVSLLLAAASASWLIWTARPDSDPVTLELYGLVTAGGLLVAASSAGAASALVFVGVVAAGVRVDLLRAAPVAAAATLAVGLGALIYSGSALGVLSYALGLAVSLLAASTARQRVGRAEQAELLLAQTQRTHEEQLRAARLEESTRLAREIHDVLAHTLAGLTIQLESTSALLERGAERDAVLMRVRRAHELAQEGLRETRRAVGALRGEQVWAPAAIEALVSDYRATADASVELTIDGDRARLSGPAGQAVLRVLQEALTNVRKHAPDAAAMVTVHAGEAPDDELVLVVANRRTADEAIDQHDRRLRDRAKLAASGGGYGLQGMRERAQLLGGTLTAGPTGESWRVELRLPPHTAEEGGGAVNAAPMARQGVV